MWRSFAISAKSVHSAENDCERVMAEEVTRLGSSGAYDRILKRIRTSVSGLRGQEETRRVFPFHRKGSRPPIRSVQRRGAVLMRSDCSRISGLYSEACWLRAMLESARGEPIGCTT